ncbi:hypothetical protein AbraIFM66950_011059 [Aspergillus brasiliensis]|nr:hypothetical protein AbraIFM66950_011059 [Aspergillus brasiliensis]
MLPLHPTLPSAYPYTRLMACFEKPRARNILTYLNGFLEAMVSSMMSHHKSPQFTLFWKKTAADDTARPHWQPVAVMNASQLMSPNFNTKQVYPGTSETRFIDLLSDAERAKCLAWTRMIDQYYDSHVD